MAELDDVVASEPLQSSPPESVAAAAPDDLRAVPDEVVASEALDNSPPESAASVAPAPLPSATISAPDILPALARGAVNRVMGDASLVTMTEKLNMAYDLIGQAREKDGEPVVLSDVHSAVDQALTDYHAAQAP